MQYVSLSVTTLIFRVCSAKQSVEHTSFLQLKEGKENIGGKGSWADSLSFLKCLKEKIVTIIILSPYYILMLIGFGRYYAPVQGL